MNNPLVSIVVPIYNMEPYLNKCINSLLQQTYSNFEVILVDDGSQDNSFAICNQFAAKDCRVKVVHKMNGGLSDARNYGVDQSSGDYIMFVDADDYLDENAMSVLVEVLAKTKADIAQMRSYIVNPDYTIRQNQSKGTKEISVIPAQEFIRDICNKARSESVCDKLFPKKILLNNRFVVGRLNEDFLFLSTILMNNYTIAEIDYAGYYYYQRIGSISHSGVGQSLIDSIHNGYMLSLQAKECFPNVEIFYKRFSLYQARTFFIVVPLNSVIRRHSNYLSVLQCVRTMKDDIDKTDLSKIDKFFLINITRCPVITISGAKLFYNIKKCANEISKKNN